MVQARPGSRLMLGMRVDATSYADAADRILSWAESGDSRYVCAATVNNAMEAHDRPEFKRTMNEADLVTPDGMPLVWGLRLLGVAGQTRVYGPDLTPLVCEMASDRGVPVGFYGGSPEALKTLVETMKRRFPALEIAYAWSPPFRDLSPEEEARIVEEINGSGARVLFIGLGTPKQEEWMMRARGDVRAVMVGVGAAFDFLSGMKKQAPRWMQARGLEWLYRLTHEPRRLWRRYVYRNPRFVILFGAQVLREKAGSGRLSIARRGVSR